MIKGDWADSIILSQVIFVRSIVSMPSDNVKWRVVVLYLKEFPLEFVNYSPFFHYIFIPCNWDLKVSWISHAVWANGSKVRNHEMTFIYFSDISSRFPIKNIDRKLDTSLNDTNFKWFNSHLSKLSFHQQGSMLWNNQQVSVRRIKRLLLHVSIASIYHNP